MRLGNLSLAARPCRGRMEQTPAGRCFAGYFKVVASIVTRVGVSRQRKHREPEVPCMAVEGNFGQTALRIRFIYAYESLASTFFSRVILFLTTFGARTRLRGIEINGLFCSNIPRLSRCVPVSAATCRNPKKTARISKIPLRSNRSAFAVSDSIQLAGGSFSKTISPALRLGFVVAPIGLANAS